MNDTAETFNPIETSLPGLTPWASVSSGHASVDLLLPEFLQARSVQLRLAKPGHGATSDSYNLVLANARTHVVLYITTDGDSDQHVRALGLQQSTQRSAAKNVRIKAIPSRDPAKIAKTFYKSIMTAVRRGTDLPGVVIIDNCDTFTFLEHGGSIQKDTEAMVELLHALAQFDLETIGNLTGVYFEDWADQSAPNLTGRAAAVVAYKTVGPSTTWGNPERQPVPADVSASYAADVHSLVAIELYTSTDGSRTEGCFTALKQNMLTASHPSVSIPLAFQGEPGKRSRWTDTLQDLLGE